MNFNGRCKKTGNLKFKNILIWRIILRTNFQSDHFNNVQATLHTYFTVHTLGDDLRKGRRGLDFELLQNVTSNQVSVVKKSRDV